MRTSHKEMRRKINAEVSKITDEELFSSAAFAAYLTDIAEAVTKRYKRRLRVETIYDTSENAMIACTNNRNILINTGNYISQSMPYRKLKAESILGLVGHEVGHMLFTNFRISETYFSELSYGRLYPQMELSEEEQESFTEVTDYFKAGTEAQKQAILKAAKLLLNILEDAYIEARICDRYTGRFATGIHLNNIRFTEMMPSVTEQLTNGCYRFSVFCNLLNQYCRSGDINNRDGYTGELLDLFYDVLPLVDDAIYDEDMKRRCYAVNRILLMVWAYIKEIAEKAEEKENTSEILQKLNKQIPQMAEVPSLNGTPIAAGSSVDTQKYIGGRTEIEEKLRKATEQESGRIPWMKTDDFDEGEEGGVEQNLSYHGAGYSTAGDDISRILTAVAKEKVQEELLNMAQSLKFEGTVQVDLVYRAGEWYIIEINPRWSGMTTTTAAMEGRNPLSIFVDSILGTDKNYSMKRNLKYALNFKMKARSQEDLIRLYGNPHVDYIMQLETSVAGMEKINYCEVVISTDQEKEDILNILNELEEEFPGLVSDDVKANAGELVAKYQ